MSSHGVVLLVMACACAGIAACTSADQRVGTATAATGGIEVLSVDAARYTGTADDPALERACHEWQLTPTQVMRFFRLATEHDDAPYSGFYQVSCAVNGELRAAQHDWSFSIGGGGTAVWRSGEEIRHWGCSAAECAPLVLMPSDGFDPE